MKVLGGEKPIDKAGHQQSLEVLAVLPHLAGSSNGDPLWKRRGSWSSPATLDTGTPGILQSTEPNGRKQPNEQKPNGGDMLAVKVEEILSTNSRVLDEQASRLFDLCGEPGTTGCIAIAEVSQKLHHMAVPSMHEEDLGKLMSYFRQSSVDGRTIDRAVFIEGIKPLLVPPRPASYRHAWTPTLPKPAINKHLKAAVRRRATMYKLSNASQRFHSISLTSTPQSPQTPHTPADPFDEGSTGSPSSLPPLTPSRLTIAINGEPIDPNRPSDEGLANLQRKNSAFTFDGVGGENGAREDGAATTSPPHRKIRLGRNTNVFFDRYHSQPIFFAASDGVPVKADGTAKPHPATNHDKVGEEYFTYSSISGNIERRNHSQFAKVIERAAVSHTDLTLAAAARECAEFRRNACEAALAEEMNEVARKYRGVPDLDLRTPDRIFKVVFVGDSGVGKTCFLHRFKPLFNATIGVDFTVRDRLVAVQLWDTAGQERFRSITKQYFRKADGVVLMYDVTSEQSFLNVRGWIESVRLGVDDCCVMCLVGNKVDLCPNENARPVTYHDGKRLADEFDMIFFETSAYTGLGINDTMRALALKHLMERSEVLTIASRLRQREEEQVEEALKLEMILQNSKGSWCCF